MTKIEWTDAVWNPVTGCSKVSAGCKNCYAEGVANRVWGERKFTDVRCHEDRLDVPLRWRKPRRVFVNSMSDLFHDDVRDDFIDRVFATMQLAPHHTFQILTKRPERMRDYMTTRVVGESQGMTYGDRIRLVGCKLLEAMPNRLANATCKRVGSVSQHPTPWPLPNVWLGVSCEDQRAADERIPLLLETPAAVRFVSVEPLLERVNLWPWDSDPKTYALVGPRKRRRATTCAPDIEGVDRMPASLDWVIVGGESGPGAPHVAGMPPPSGWCHRHAPRPGPVALRRWRRDDPEQKGFPVIIERSEDIAFPAVSYYDFCCEWLPRPKGAS